MSALAGGELRVVIVGLEAREFGELEALATALRLDVDQLAHNLVAAGLDTARACGLAAVVRQAGPWRGAPPPNPEGSDA